jgi:hypothetical protein
MYVRMCVGLVERAMRAKKTTDWTAKRPKDSSPIHRSGEGQTAVTRPFYQLGWTKGRQPHVHGDLKGQNIPGLIRGKKELVQLARKYDSPLTATASVSRAGIEIGTHPTHYLQVFDGGSAFQLSTGGSEVRLLLAESPDSGGDRLPDRVGPTGSGRVSSRTFSHFSH